MEQERHHEFEEAPFDGEAFLSDFNEELAEVKDDMVGQWFVPAEVYGSGEEKEADREYLERIDAIIAEASHSRMELMGSVVKRALVSMDLDSREKVMTFALEMMPLMSATYAITGRRIQVVRSEETGALSVRLEKLPLFERLRLIVSDVVTAPVAKAIFSAAKEAELDRKFSDAFARVAAMTRRVITKPV